ncbi:hypothetical protein AAJCM20276_27490 [Acetobacter aceti]|uniref:Uncharacterized protein n=1 Tax=Acetobacter aceti TaxID=435 RepID=A0A6S6PN75_ACEAC|nr:hypothetical protein [Acetobacter aceti]BCI68125.1 hypothetical protein AAJCM20276_27490 [Acetobacter aceti]
MTNALTALNHGIAHHDWPLVERAARELRDQNTALAAENDRLWLERNNNLTNIRDLNTELDISRERMARPVTLIIAPAIGLWLSSLPCSTADAVQVALDWIDTQIEKVPEQIVVSTRLAVGMAALTAIVCAGMLWGFEAVAGGF